MKTTSTRESARLSNGVNKLQELFATRGTRTLFMAHMIAGYPSKAESIRIAKALIAGGADIIEMQIPFSDPMADGPTIAAACEEALARGASVKQSCEVLNEISKLGAPVVVMSYTNPVYRASFPKFAAAIKKAGASGLIVPDCPVDTPEGRGLIHACNMHNIFLIPVVSPGVPEARLKTLAKNAKGFVYMTSRQGITGANSSFAKTLMQSLKTLKRVFKLPIAVGFGVKNPADVASLSKHVDLVIAGSVFVGATKNASKNELESSIAKLTRSLTRAL